MNKIAQFATVSVLALLVAAPAMAQSRIIGSEALDDRIDEIERDVNTDLARGEDAARFNDLGVVQGFRGSFALTASAASGNSDTGELSAAGRLSYGVGPWNHSIGLAAEYGESGGVQNEEKFFATYEANRSFTPQFYMFGVGRYEYDGFATNRHDAFLGFGPGYRIVNSESVAWRVQAGPGVRFVEDQFGASTTEVAGIASSRVFYKLTDTMSLTNDTDILGSDVNTLIQNDFGINFKVSDNMSTRVSYRTDYNTNPAPGFAATDNTFGVALVVGF
ncbi:MAG: DUF481 domain-containing protein [Rhodobacter sp.]|nr:DUF481 domain-containing protein [Rhodobacter sp.]